MGLFTRMKNGIKSKANAAIDKAIDPAREVEIAIMELEEGRKQALVELLSYKSTAKQMEQEIEKFTARQAEWEKRAMTAVRAGDDEAARQALREKKSCQVELAKIQKDRDEAAGYAIELNKSRKIFETKLQALKLRKGTLATQLAAARAGGDAFGNDTQVWDRFQQAEERIDAEVVETEVDAALRGETAADQALDAKLLAASRAAGMGGDAAQLTGGAGTDDALAEMKAKVAAQRLARQQALAPGPAAPAAEPPQDPSPAKERP